MYMGGSFAFFEEHGTSAGESGSWKTATGPQTQLRAFVKFRGGADGLATVGQADIVEEMVGRVLLEAYAELTGWSTVLLVATAQVVPLSTEGASAESTRLSKIMYAVLFSRVQIVHFTPEAASDTVTCGSRFGPLVRDWPRRCEK